MARDAKDQSPPHVLLVGAGRMGSALLRGWQDQELGLEIKIIDPHLGESEIAKLEEGGAIFIDDVQDLARPPDAIVLAVKPQTLREAAAPLVPIAGTALILSIAAGIRIATLEALFGDKAAILRAMPNLPAQIGMGITAIYPNRRIRLAQMDLTERLLSAVGATIAVTAEDQLDAVTAISGSGPAYVFWLCECLENAAMEAGLDPEAAQILARATIAGSGAMLGLTEDDASRLREGVTSPGGTTAAALDILMSETAGLQPLLTRAVQAAHKRAKDLGG